MQIENELPEFDLTFDDTIVNDLIKESSKDNDQTDQDNDDVIDNADIDNDTALNTEEIVEEKEYPEDADPVAIAAYEKYVEQGIIDKDDDFDGSWEKLDASLENLPQRVLNTLVAKASDTTKDVVRYIFSADNITLEDVVKFVKVNAEEMNEVESVETMDDARSYLEKVYQDRGIKPRQIDAMLSALEEDDLLLEEAKEELEKLNLARKDKPKTEALIAEKENETAEVIAQKNKFASDIFTELQNTGWKPSKIEEVKNRISKNDINPILTQIFKSPKAFVKMADFIGHFKNGDIDYDKFINTIETPKGKDIKSKFENIVNSPTLSTKSNLKKSTNNTALLEPVFD